MIDVDRFVGFCEEHGSPLYPWQVEFIAGLAIAKNGLALEMIGQSTKACAASLAYLSAALAKTDRAPARPRSKRRRIQKKWEKRWGGGSPGGTFGEAEIVAKEWESFQDEKCVDKRLLGEHDG